MKENCFDCALKRQRLEFKKIIQQARELAKKENRTVTIYINADGGATLTDTGNAYQYITPHL